MFINTAVEKYFDILSIYFQQVQSIR